MARCVNGCVMKAKDGDIETVGLNKICTCSVCGTVYTINKLTNNITITET
jgi:hypothetical protein